MEFTPDYELTLLLLFGARTMIDLLHQHLAERGYDDVRPAHGFVFHRLAPKGATGNELAEFLDITKQAASEMVDYLEQHDYVVRQPHPTDRRGKIVILTLRGWNCIQETEIILAHLEEQWATVVGIKHMEALKVDLRQVITLANGGTFPQKFRPTW
jgi:DNA-binding MarR family transcriptional regulator